tara:strand:- start:12048 stop:12740 length:693 start_codon:yes stop_codon:yes gene_type:complete
VINLKSKIKAILFDIGGPIDSEILNDKLLKLHFIEEFSKHEITIKDYDIENCLERLITNFDDNIYLSLCENFSNNPNIKKSVYNNILSRAKERDLIRNAPEIPDDAIEVLKYLSKYYKLGVVANQTLDALALLKSTGINKYFDNFEVSDSIGLEKPDKRIFLHVMNILNVSAEECIMIGDRIDNDIIPANKLNIFSIRIKTGRFSCQNPRNVSEKPKFEINNLLELKNIL